MSAKYGCMRSIRLLGCLMATMLLGSALFASVASAKKTPPTNPTAYINMGDSVSFGYSEEKFDKAAGEGDPITAFENNLVNEVAAKLAKAEAKNDTESPTGNLLETFNLACPGELSKGLIGDGELAKGLEEAHEFSEGEAPCGWHNVDGLARHYEYGGASQLEAALGIIKSGIPVKDVTYQIGSNDEIRKLTECASKTYREAHGFATEISCVIYEAEHVLFPTIINNLAVIAGTLRNAGYTGPIGILGFYNPDEFLVSGSNTLQRELNENVEAQIAKGTFGPNVAYGNPFKKTNPAGKKSQTEAEVHTLQVEALCKYTEECNEFDKRVNLIEYLEEHGYSKEEAEAAATPEQVAKFPKGDIHPTPAGDELFAKELEKALKKAA